jgi:pyruvate/2-oxoglutarate dehydrogenase complex dihydrolipoamide dehydrogenase (E3) component
MAAIKSYDFITLGAGSAGFNAARTAASLGKKVAIVDGARQLGGLCILRGCMPSKTLLWPAEILHLARKADTFGLRIPIAEVNMKALRKRKRAIIADFASYRVKALESGRYDLYRSQARFTSADTLELADGTRLRGSRFLIGTGSRVSVPPIPGLAGSRCWTSDDVLDLDQVPPSVIVLGGGIVACELAQFLRRIGSKVIQVQRSAHILKDYSPEASAVVEQAFRDEGIELHTGTRLESVKARRRDFEVTFTDLATGTTLTRRATRLLNALGREPNTSNLGLEAAGVKLAPSGRIVTNKWQQTSQPHIYAGGDVCGPHDIVHLAVAQGELAARHAFGVKGLKPVDYSQLLGVAFTDPQLASIGLNEAALKEAKKPFLSASYPFNDHGKSILMDANYGFVKVLAAPRTGRLLGAEIVGKDAGELIHCFNTALALGATVKDMLAAPWYHPTLAEILTYPLEEIADQL